MTRKGTSLFAQIITLVVETATFRRIVRDHRGDKHSKGLRCRDQFVAMMFLHLSKVTSLREIRDGLRSVAGKVAHLGMGKIPGHSTLAYANAHRPWQIYRVFFYAVLAGAEHHLRGRRRFRFKNRMLSMDATFLQLCLSLFPWAQFRSTKGAVKLHMLYDHDGYFPVFCHVTDGTVHETHVAKQVLVDPDIVPAGSIVVFDRAYVEFSLFALLAENHAFFDTRVKEKMNWRVVTSYRVPEHRNILRDVDVEFTGAHAVRFGQKMLRMVESVDPDTGHTVLLVTNNWTLGASTIARIYRDRWQIEVFFETLKQHLKIRTFVGTSENALLVQIWTALIGVLALKLLKALSRFGWSMSNLVAMVRLNLFTYRDLGAWLDAPYAEVEIQQSDQLSFGFP